MGVEEIRLRNGNFYECFIYFFFFKKARINDEKKVTNLHGKFTESKSIKIHIENTKTNPNTKKNFLEIVRC